LLLPATVVVVLNDPVFQVVYGVMGIVVCVSVGSIGSGGGGLGYRQPASLATKKQCRYPTPAPPKNADSKAGNRVYNM
jgi:hypothetical protein